MTDDAPKLRPHGDPIRDKLPTGNRDQPDPDDSPADIPAPEPVDEVGSDDDPGAGAD